MVNNTLIDIVDMAALLGKKRSTVEYWSYNIESFPACAAMMTRGAAGKRRRMYRREDVLAFKAWLEDHLVNGKLSKKTLAEPPNQIDLTLAYSFITSRSARNG